MSSQPAKPASARPARLTLGALGRIFRRALAGWWKDDVPRLGASLAYYTLFALAPILVVAISIGGLVFGAEAVRGEVVGQIQGLIGREGAEAVQAMLEGASRPAASIAATVAGIITFFIGATSAFLELQTALNAIWHVEPKTGGSYWRILVMQRVISFGLVVALGFLLVTSLLVSAALAAIHRYMGNAFPGIVVLWEALNVVVSLEACLEGCLGGRSGDSRALYHWKVDHRPVSGDDERGEHLRCSQLGDRHPGLGVLLGPGDSARRGVHPGLRRRIRAKTSPRGVCQEGRDYRCVRPMSRSLLGGA
jgi:hypothetical protein